MAKEPSKTSEIYLPTSSVWGFWSVHILTNPFLFQPKLHCIVNLICILQENQVEPFSYVSWLVDTLISNMTIKIFLFLSVLKSISFVGYRFWHYFIPFWGLPFHCLQGMFWWTVVLTFNIVLGAFSLKAFYRSLSFWSSSDLTTS